MISQRSHFYSAVLNAVTFKITHCIPDPSFIFWISAISSSIIFPLLFVLCRLNVSRILVLISGSEFLCGVGSGTLEKEFLTYVETHQFPALSTTFICFFGFRFRCVPFLCFFLITPITVPRQWLRNSGSGRGNRAIFFINHNLLTPKLKSANQRLVSLNLLRFFCYEINNSIHSLLSRVTN